MEQPAGTPIWPTTVGAVGVVVGGLQCYGGCVAIGGLDPISALHTATQLPGGDDPVLAALMAQGPPTALAVTMGGIEAVMAIVLILASIALIQHRRGARRLLRCWSTAALALVVVATVIAWAPRWSLVAEHDAAEAAFVAWLVIRVPLTVALPIFLLAWFSRSSIRDEMARWA